MSSDRYIAERLAEAVIRNGLTLRECQVVASLARGLSNFEIAAGLGIATETVKSHVCHVLEKLEARSRAHAVALVLTPTSDVLVDLAEVRSAA